MGGEEWYAVDRKVDTKTERTKLAVWGCARVLCLPVASFSTSLAGPWAGGGFFFAVSILGGTPLFPAGLDPLGPPETGEVGSEDLDEQVPMVVVGEEKVERARIKGQFWDLGVIEGRKCII